MEHLDPNAYLRYAINCTDANKPGYALEHVHTATLLLIQQLYNQCSPPRDDDHPDHHLPLWWPTTILLPGEIATILGDDEDTQPLPLTIQDITTRLARLLALGTHSVWCNLNQSYIRGQKPLPTRRHHTGGSNV